MNPVIALITCPHCGNEKATVHKQGGRNKSLYYRCYGGEHGDCGTVQIPREAGQKFINENMRPVGDKAAQEINSEATAVAAEKQAKAIEQQRKAEQAKPRKSFLSVLLSE